MGLKRLKAIFEAKANRAVDALEDPRSGGACRGMTWSVRQRSALALSRFPEPTSPLAFAESLQE